MRHVIGLGARLRESMRLRLHLNRHLLVRLHLRLQRRGEQRLVVLKHELCLLSLHHCEQLQLGVDPARKGEGEAGGRRDGPAGGWAGGRAHVR